MLQKIDVLYAIFNDWTDLYGKVGFNFAMLFPEYDQEWDLLGISTPIVNCWPKLFIEDWGEEDAASSAAAVRCSITNMDNQIIVAEPQSSSHRDSDVKAPNINLRAPRKLSEKHTTIVLNIVL